MKKKLNKSASIITGCFAFGIGIGLIVSNRRSRRQGTDRSVAVVAGGASGIGRAIAYQLAGQGTDVIVVNRDGMSLQTFIRDNERGALHIGTLAADLTKPADVQEMVRSIVARHGRIDYFFNCAGAVQGGEVRDTPLEAGQKVMGTNQAAITCGTYYVYRQMVAQRSGHIVNLSSAAGLFPAPFMAYYGASKSAVASFSHALRAEARAYNVRVSVACPGFVKTPIFDKATYSNLSKRRTMALLFERIPIQSPEQAARRIIRGVINNQATIHTWYGLHLVWLAYRLIPGMYIRVCARLADVIRRELRQA